MNIDRYLKIVLTLIAIFLGFIAFKPLLTTQKTIAASDADFSHLQFSSNFREFFDTKTGELWNYQDLGRPSLKGRLISLGKPCEGAR